MHRIALASLAIGLAAQAGAGLPVLLLIGPVVGAACGAFNGFLVTRIALPSIVVTIGTIRIIFVSRGMKVLAPILGFFEVTIWLFAITQIMQNLTDVSCFLAFAGEP